MNAEPLPHTPNLKRALNQATDLARETGHHAVTAEHLVLATLHDPDSSVARALHHAGANLAAITDALHETLRNGPYPDPPEPPEEDSSRKAL
ncbi:Clp protease N-terminal domain-containing protein [Nocardia veterana]|uniref:Clp R domain-containing protein n=1 Tax=Nocardia veterana TaxID=132249 RepID=A0A7X6M1K1_9NOCA|nr:Clp protease N-terminal domain-containing protein [Nocardia veterana]NKY88548.1 hypothetical protein [Nocardia veterana]